MKTTTTQFLKACSLSVALLGSAAFVLTVSLPEAAYADNGKGNGGGNGNGGGKSNSNGGGADKSSAKSGGNGKSDGSTSSSSKSAEKTKSVKKKAAKKAAASEVPEPTEVGEVKSGKIKLKGVEGDGYAHPSELGALNAAHANPRALENASPNSRVGRIAAYRNTVLDGQELADTLEEKTAELGTLIVPARSVADIDAALVTANADVIAKAGDVSKLEGELAAVSDPALAPAIEAQLLIARTALTDAGNVVTGLEVERTAAVEYQTLTDEITDLTEQLEEQPMIEREALEAAANKPVTDDVEAEVRKLLGL